ncbi:MAG: hypothetical protein RLO01_12170 [Thalassobaculaceae bacterium]
MTASKIDKPAGDGRERVDFKLPSGKTASMLKHPKGKDMRLAGRMATAHPTDQTWLNFCLVAQTTLIDGAEILPDNLDDFSLADTNELIGKLQDVTQGKFPASTPSLP